jgi:SAM-dependent methyltransferase
MEIKKLIQNIKGRSCAGSSTKDGKLYHDLPFKGMEHFISHRGRTRERIDHICSLVEVKDKNILDIGCSVGGLTLGTALNGSKSSVGVDYDQSSINIANEAKKLLKAENASFHCKETNIEWMKSMKKVDIVIWMSHWMWMVKEYGMDIAKQMLFEVSKKTDVMIFESASDDGMARIKGSTQDDIEKWLFENTVFRSIKRIQSVGGWLHRDVFVCTRPLTILDGIKRASTSIIERISPDLIKKTYRKGYEWMAKREAEFLRRLDKYDNFPKLKEEGEDYIVMTFCGRHEYTDFNETCQIKEILDCLKNEHIKHRDLKHSNLLTLNKKLYLIDFGWSIFDNETDTPVKSSKSLHGNVFGSDEIMAKRIFKSL